MADTYTFGLAPAAPDMDEEALAVATDALQEGMSKENIDELFREMGVDPAHVHVEMTVDSETGIAWKRFRPGAPSPWHGIDRGIRGVKYDRVHIDEAQAYRPSFMELITRETDAIIGEMTEQAARSYWGYRASDWRVRFRRDLYGALLGRKAI